MKQVFVFNVNGMEFSAVADSKFAAKKKLARHPNVPDGPRIFVRTEPFVPKPVNQVVEEV